MKAIVIMLALFLVSCQCEENESSSVVHAGYYQAVIQKGTKDDPVWMVQGLRKKGGPYTFYADTDNLPQFIEDTRYITPENLDRENAEIVLVEIKIVE